MSIIAGLIVALFIIGIDLLKIFGQWVDEQGFGFWQKSLIIYGGIFVVGLLFSLLALIGGRKPFYFCTGVVLTKSENSFTAIT